jgi:hypothetical protein
MLRAAASDSLPDGEEMTPLAVAVIIVGILCLLNLLLTLGVLRRLREHAALLSRTPIDDPEPGLAIGEQPAAFAAVTTAGRAVTGPAGLRVVAFFSSSCSVCPGKVAPFAQYVRSRQLDPESVLAVVDAGGAESYLAQLAPVTRICVEPHGGAISAAFAVTGFPAFFLLDPDGVILTSGYDPDSLPEPAAV